MKSNYNIKMKKQIIFRFIKEIIESLRIERQIKLKFKC